MRPGISFIPGPRNAKPKLMNILNLLCSLGLINKDKMISWSLRQTFGTEKGAVLNQVVDAVASGTHTVVPTVNPTVMSIFDIVNSMKGLK